MTLSYSDTLDDTPELRVSIGTWNIGTSSQNEANHSAH